MTLASTSVRIRANTPYPCPAHTDETRASQLSSRSRSAEVAERLTVLVLLAVDDDVDVNSSRRDTTGSTTLAGFPEGRGPAIGSGGSAGKVLGDSSMALQLFVRVGIGDCAVRRGTAAGARNGDGSFSSRVLLASLDNQVSHFVDSLISPTPSPALAPSHSPELLDRQTDTSCTDEQARNVSCRLL